MTFSDHPMSTAAELLDPKVFASIQAEFHEVFVQKREEVRKLRAGMRASKSARSGRDGHQAASEYCTLVDTKRSREGTGRPVRPLKRPRIIENVPNTPSGATRKQCYRDLWENHAFVKLSPTRTLQSFCKVRVREEMYEPLRVWKEVERGMAVYEYALHKATIYMLIILIVSTNAIESVKLIVSGLATSGALCSIAMKSLPLKR
jgi:hypothetical protein